ncbi:MAG: nicotinamide riboside transporter PnuC [Bacteroidota bacterium]
MSYLELFGLITGTIAVILSAYANLWSWIIGIVNVILSFFLFYQVQLYPDMFLQVFFFVTNILGWWRWANPGEGEADLHKELKVSWDGQTATFYYRLGRFAWNNYHGIVREKS